jgi:hypothetical protein
MKLGRAALAVGTLGGSEVWRAADKKMGLKDLLLGKSSPGKAGYFTDLDPMQQGALDTYNEELSRLRTAGPMKVDQIARAEIANQERLAKQGIADTEKRAQSLIAQRGLNRSSAGISSLLGIRSNLGNQLNAIRAQQPAMMRNLQNEDINSRINRLTNLSGGMNNILSTRMYNAPVAATGRQGGILPLLTGGAGAILGSKAGPQGAAAGYQIGSGLGQSFTQMG